MSDDEFPNFTSELCHHLVMSRYENLEINAAERAKVCLLDWLGLAIRGSREELSRIIHEVISQEDIIGDSPVLGTTIRTNGLFAAFANGAQGHAMDFDDTHEPSLVHVSSSLWPALIAKANSGMYEGRKVIAAFAAGVDAQADIGRNVGAELTSRGFHATSVIGHIGAAIALSNLIGLDPDRAELAVGIVATQAGGLNASFGTMSKPLHPGKAAMDAMLAVRLAENGYTGARDIVTRSNGLLASFLGHVPEMRPPSAFRFGHAVSQVSIKPYASCLLTHPCIDAGRQLSAKVEIDQVGSVVCRVNPLAIKVAGKSNPSTALEGKFSIGYCIAVALLTSELRDSDFSEVRMTDHRIRDLSAKVTLIADESLSAIQAVVEVNFKSGDHIFHRVDAAKGNPANPMSLEESLVKFMDLVEPILGYRQGEALAQLCMKAEELSDFSRVSSEATIKEQVTG